MTDSVTQNNINTPLPACFSPSSARPTQPLPIISPYFELPNVSIIKGGGETAQNTRYTPCHHHHLHPPSTLNITLYSLLLQITFPSFSLFYTTITKKNGNATNARRPTRSPYGIVATTAVTRSASIVTKLNFLLIDGNGVRWGGGAGLRGDQGTWWLV